MNGILEPVIFEWPHGLSYGYGSGKHYPK